MKINGKTAEFIRIGAAALVFLAMGLAFPGSASVLQYGCQNCSSRPLSWHLLRPFPPGRSLPFR